MDDVLTGCEVTATDPESMAVLVHSGTYKIDCETFVLNASAQGLTVPIMKADSTVVMGTNITMSMGETTYSIAINAAPSAGKYRYDIIYADKAGIANYLAVVAGVNPYVPSNPSNTLVLATIFVAETVTAIYDDDINGREWKLPVPSELRITLTNPMPWSPISETITVTVLNQYGVALSGNYTIKLTMMSGTGWISKDNSNWVNTDVSLTGTFSSCSFYYKRDEALDDPENGYYYERGPLLKFDLNSTVPVSNLVVLELLKEGGGVIV